MDMFATQMKVVRRVAPAIFFLALASATAYGQLSITPLISEVRVYSGGYRTFSVVISNSGNTTLDCAISKHALRVEGEGLPVPVDEAPRSCKDWITVTPESFSLSPGQGVKLNCQLQAAKDASGGYYGVLSCLGVPQGRDRDPEQKRSGAGMTFSYRVMSIIMVTVPAGKVEAILDAGEPIITSSQGGSGYLLELPVRNRGNIHARMTGKADIRSKSGQKIEEFPLTAGRGFLLPDHDRMFRSRGQINIPDGLYQVQIELTPVEGGQAMRKTFPFFVSDGKAEVEEMDPAAEAALLAKSAGFIVNPAQVAQTVHPGARRTQAVELVNLQETPVMLRFRLLEWYRDPSGNDLVADRKAPHERSARAMLTLPEETLTLPAMGRRRIPVTITVPRDATGETYAALAVDRVGAGLDDAPAALARRSSLLRIIAQGTGACSAEISDFTAERQPNGGYEFKARITNNGDVGIIPELNCAISDETGATVANVSPGVRPDFIQAGTSFLLTAQLSRLLNPGKYSATLMLRLKPDQPPLTAKTDFEIAANPQPGTNAAEDIRPDVAIKD